MSVLKKKKNTVDDVIVRQRTSRRTVHNWLTLNRVSVVSVNCSGSTSTRRVMLDSMFRLRMFVFKKCHESEKARTLDTPKFRCDLLLQLGLQHFVASLHFLQF